MKFNAKQNIIKQFKPFKVMCKIRLFVPYYGNFKKTMLAMYLFVLITFISIVQAAAKPGYSQSIRFSFNPGNVSLRELFNQIEKNSEFVFLYHDSTIDLNKEVFVKAENETVEQVLEKVLGPAENNFKISDREIIITKAVNLTANTDTRLAQQPQTKSVTGKVTDVSGAPVPGVSVLVRGTSNGTITDNNGNYSLSNVPENASLQFSFIGLKTQQATVAGRNTINVVMQEEILGLEEVVAIGYGTQRKMDLTGSVVSVSEKVLKERPLMTINQGLIGRMAGVAVELNDATPGSLTSIKIRGAGSITAGNEPLYVIDGFPLGQSQVNSLLPSDIESINVLKDASSTAIYGARGSNGVVIITTKSGSNKAAQISLDVTHGIGKVAERDYYDLLNANEYAEFIGTVKNELWVRDGNDPNVPESQRPLSYQVPAYVKNRDLSVNTDWQDVIFKTSSIQNYALSVRGGSEKSKFYFSLGSTSDDGAVIGANYEKYTARLKMDVSLIKDRLKAGLNLAPSYAKKRVSIINSGDVFSSVIGSALAMPPIIPVKNTDGSYGSTAGIPGINFYGNPIQLARDYEDKSKLFSMLANSYIDLKILEGLNIRTSLGLVYDNTQQDIFRPKSLWRPFAPAPTYADGSSATNNSINWLSETMLTYNTIFNDNHKVDVLAGFTAQRNRDQGNYLYARNFPNDLVHTLNAGQVQSGNSSVQEWSLLSYLGRANYSYKDRYLLTATIRFDGSSRFGANNRYGTFPSVAAAWRISEEPFAGNIQFLSNLKLRLSYGTTGNNAIGNYAPIGLVGNSNQTFGPGSGSTYSAIFPTTTSNPSLTWEKAKKVDIGLDLGLFRERIALILDYYNNRTSDLLLNVNLPTTTGFSSALQNIGEVENKGFEITLMTRNISTPNFAWETNFNVSFNKNKVLKLGPTGDPIYDFYGTRITQIGKEIGSTNGLQAIGILTQADIDAGVAIFPGEQAGDVKYKDVNKDGVISNFNGPDGINIGDPFPEYIFGLSNTFTYKHFDLSVYLNGQAGGRTLDLIGQGMWSSGGNNIFASWYQNRYISDAQPGDGKTPRLTFPLGGLPDTRLVQKTDFIRLTNITLGYNLPPDRVSFIAGLRVYLSVENMFTWSKFDGYNPQVKSSGAEQRSTLGGFALGGAYPIPRIISLGLNVSF